MHASGLYGRLRSLKHPLGDVARRLAVGRKGVRVEGLDTGLALQLDRRWGGFLSPCVSGEPQVTVRLFDGGPDHWLGAPQNGETYRIEATEDSGRRVVASYHFAIAAEPHSSWRVGITAGSDEPRERILDNVMRYVTGYMAAEDGGFAMHAAGVLYEGRAYLFAGASRSGKSTVVRSLAPAPTLGDDFGLVLPADDGWYAPALPFDNSESAAQDPPTGLFPVAGIWRLYQAEATHVERPSGGRAVASLMGCVAFPWTMPEHAECLLAQVERFVREGRYEHLHFTRDAALWTHLV